MYGTQNLGQNKSSLKGYGLHRNNEIVLGYVGLYQDLDSRNVYRNLPAQGFSRIYYYFLINHLIRPKQRLTLFT